MAKKLKDEVQEPGAKRLSDKYYEPGEITWDLRPGWNDLPHIVEDDGGDEREPNIPWWQNSPIYNETPYDGVDDPEDVAWDTYTPSPTDYSKRTSSSQEYFDLISRMGGSPNGGTNGNKGDKGDDGKTPVVNQGNADLTTAMAYLQQMQGMIDGIDLDKFKFDLNGEELYQQYRDQYLRNGRLAMMDTMGQAAGLTGGYGSSYAQNAGQQAYQGYVNELNAVVPQVYDRAYQRWGDEQDLKLRKYQLMADQYGRILDQEDRDDTRQYNADKLASEEEIARIKADQAENESIRKANADREAALIKSGSFTYGPDRELLYIGDYRANDDGTYSYAGNDVEDIHGIPSTTIDRKVEDAIENWISTAGASFPYFIEQKNGRKIMLDRLVEENKWDEVQKQYALKHINDILSTGE